MNERNTRAMTCRCSGYPHPHRRGSLQCLFQASGEWKTYDQFLAAHAQLETPVYEFEEIPD